MRQSLFWLLMSLFPMAATAGSEEITTTGWVSDASCGAEHTKPGGEDCVQKCIKGAPHLNPEWVAQRMVFVTDEEPERRIWFVDNPEALKGYEGKHLRIVGKLDRKSKTILVETSSLIVDEN